ncbi:response regulator [Algiphilus sp. W345]|uniref:Response regulator n=1 Tax=Banduia mediterranea TaxID=3075609 RepID=A0ABU2WL23_9GAMM|nr:response regulator [Algiphilus sp. W345]MDT0498220.1 response regulator [Algiphilus sp. W345]
MNSGNVQVFLVDDNEPFRRSTAWLLEAADLDVRDFPSGPGLLDTIAQESPTTTASCLISDVRMPGMSGLELMEELRRREVRLPIVFVTAHGDVPLAVEAMRRGASNFIEKPFEGETLVHAVRIAVHEPPPASRNPSQCEEKLSRLTPRERQVMDLVVTGKLNKTIADALDISIKTVELHRANMMSKLGARNVPQLVRLVLGYA